MSTICSTLSRRRRLYLHQATGALSLAIWLLMAMAEIHPPFHAWLHGGTIPKDDDDCAIVLIHHGKMDMPVAVVDISVPMPVIVGDVLTPASIFAAVDRLPRPNRGPPTSTLPC